jgi:GxxExxY protein
VVRGMLIERPFHAVTAKILSAAIEVHRTLGPGLLESTYAPCLHFELSARKLRFVAQRAIPIVYKGIQLDTSYRVDLIVEDLVVVETKSVATLVPVHEAQVLTYMKLTHCPAGLLINFNVPKLMDGVKRLVLPGKSTEGSEETGSHGGTEKRRSQIVWIKEFSVPPFLRVNPLPPCPPLPQQC